MNGITARYVAVCGPGTATPEVAAQADEVGRLLARAGAVLVCGGMGGAMDAAARGAAAEGGTVVGILPDATRAGACEHLTVAIPTGLGDLRNGLVVRAADALIAVGGEFGTLSEIALARKAGVPVVGLGTWQLARAGRIVADGIVRARTPAEAVDAALHLAGT